MLFPKPVRRQKNRSATSGPTLRGERVLVATLRWYVFERDKGCIFRADPDHECRDQFGWPHEPDRYIRLQLGHVPEAGRNALQKKAPLDEHHAVTVCAAKNVPGESRADREFERAYLARVEP